jgi:hypothetical protein
MTCTPCHAGDLAHLLDDLDADLLALLGLARLGRFGHALHERRGYRRRALCVRMNSAAFSERSGPTPTR